MSDAVWTHGRNDVTQSDHLQDLARRYQPPVVLLYRDSECAGIPPEPLAWFEALLGFSVCPPEPR
jgi:hypothetical protein